MSGSESNHDAGATDYSMLLAKLEQAAACSSRLVLTVVGGERVLKVLFSEGESAFFVVEDSLSFQAEAAILLALEESLCDPSQRRAFQRHQGDLSLALDAYLDLARLANPL